MDRFDEVFSVLTEDQGWSEENARKIMVYCAEEGMNPIEASLRFIGGLGGLPTVDLRKSFFNPWNQFPKNPQPQRGLPKPESSRLPTRALPPSTVDAVVSKPQTPQQPPAPKPTFSSVGTTTVKPQQTPQQPKAPAPQWGGSSQAQDVKRLNQLTGGGPLGDKSIPKPVVSSGRMGAPQGPALSTNVAPKPKFATSMGQAPKPNWNPVKPKIKPSLNPKTFVKNAIKGALVTAAGYGLNKLMGAGSDKSSAPTADQKAQKLAQQKAETTAPSAPEPTGERSASASAAKQETAKANAQRRRDSAASFDKAFAAARGSNKSTFTWRGKSYNTKLK